MQKIEKMTLYMVDMNKRINRLESENAELHKQAVGRGGWRVGKWR